MQVKINNKEKVILFMKDEWEYPVKFKVTDDSEPKNRNLEFKLKTENYFSLEIWQIITGKLKTLEQLTDEENLENTTTLTFMQTLQKIPK